CVEQRASDFDRAKRRLKLPFGIVTAAEAVSARELFDLLAQRAGRNRDGAREGLDGIGRDHGARLLGIAKILELARDRRDALVENIEREAARLAQHLRRGFRIAERLVVEAPPVRVDLD